MTKTFKPFEPFELFNPFKLFSKQTGEGAQNVRATLSRLLPCTSH